MLWLQRRLSPALEPAADPIIASEAGPLRTQRQWQLNPHRYIEGRATSRDLADPMVATLLLYRGTYEPDVAQRFMAARLADMPDPGLMADIKRAADLLILRSWLRKKSLYMVTMMWMA